MITQLNCAGKTLDLTTPQIMGVLNVTPDSFSDGGCFFDLDKAVEQAHRMVEAGAAIIDVGGESTRPFAAPVSESAELDRVMPVIERLVNELDVPISIDTRKPAVMREAIRAGVGMINDINALRAPGAIEAVQGHPIAVVLMHMQNQPETMQSNPAYHDVTAELTQFFEERLSACVEAGISNQQIVLDPGFGFGKTPTHNLQLLSELAKLKRFKCHLMVGWSRKSTLGVILNKPPADRLYGSLAAALLALERGANILRVHDVGPTRDVVRVINAMQQAALGCC